MMNNLFENAVNGVLREYFEGDEFYVYHSAREETLSSIFKFGFEAYYAASKMGNTYGRGVYTTFDLNSSIVNAKRGDYGRVILKCRVKSLDNYIIFDERLARTVYGRNWKVYDQLKILCPPNVFKRLPLDAILAHNHYTSYNAIAVTRQARVDKSFAECFDGLIFYGSTDGKVCVVNNFKNIYQVEYSMDFGKSWRPIEKDAKFDEYAVNDVDLKYEIGNYYDEVPFNFTNNFAKVRKDGKYNYLYSKTYKDGVISPVWFDEGADTFNNKGECLVLLNGEKYFLYHEKDSDYFEVLNSDGEYLCYLDDFESYLNGEEDTW